MATTLSTTGTIPHSPSEDVVESPSLKKKGNDRMTPGESSKHPQKTVTPNKNYISLFNKKEIIALFHGLRLANSKECDYSKEKLHMSPAVFTASPAPVLSEKMFCSFCSCSFENRQYQKDHYTLDWHRFNLKQRMIGVQPVSEEDFEKMTDNVSSISGSESSFTEEDSREDDLSPTSSKRGLFPLPHRNPNSLSESDTDEEVVGKQRIKYCKVIFKNSSGQFISIHRCVLHGNKNIPAIKSDLVSMATKLHERVQWLILMAGGGHFAGAVFHGETVVVHKTFHRYTVRAKRGTAQGLHDKQSGRHAKSGGATLRRYNEAALIDDIHQLLQSWQDHIKECTHVFLRAPSYNRTIFVGGKNAPFDKNDTRLVNIPFTTRRPTFKELKRVQIILSSVKLHDSETDINTLLMLSNKKTVANQQVKPPDERSLEADEINEGISARKCQVPVPDEAKALADMQSDEDDGDIELVMEEMTTSTADLKEFDMTKRKRRKRKPKSNNSKNDNEMKDSTLKILQYDMFTACKTGNVDTLTKLLQTLNHPAVEHQSSINESKVNQTDSKLDEATTITSVSIETGDVQTIDILNQTLDTSKITLLHVAAEAGHKSIVWILLEAGANPVLRNSKGLPAFSVSKNKETRKEFRRFVAAFPEKYDYTKAQIPSALTSQMELEKAAKSTERKKVQKKFKKAKQKEQKEVQRKEEVEAQERELFMSLSDREKRALAAERRMAQNSLAPVALRCWLCGKTLATKPFSYMDFNFCSMECLKKHKA